jgi:hypothetical protein
MGHTESISIIKNRLPYYKMESVPISSSVIKSRKMRWAGHVARMGEKRNAYRILVEMPEGKKALGRPRRR